MPSYTITAPDGRQATLTGDTPPTEADIDAVFAQHPASAEPRASTREPDELHSYDPSMLERIKNAVNDSQIRTDILGPSRNTLMKQGQDRMRQGDEARPQSLQERGMLPSLQAAAREPLATTARVLPGMLASVGGPAGAGLNAGGEAAGQMLDPRPRMAPNQVLEGSNGPSRGPDMGRIAQAGVIGAVPLGGAAGVMNAIKNAVKMGGAGYAGEQARSLIDEGKTSDSAGAQGGIMAAITAAVPVIAKVVGQLSKSVTPEAQAAVNNAMRNNAETDASIAKVTDRGGVVNPASQNPGVINKTLGSVAGLQNLKNRAIEINTPILDDMARSEASLKPTDVINEDALKVARHRVMEPLNEMRSMGLGDQVDNWQKANQLRQDLIEARTMGQIAPAEFRSQMADRQAAMRASEQTIDAAATQAGRPDLVGVLPKIQEDLAKNYDVRRITPSGTGHVNANLASGLAAQRVDAPETLTGGLRDIANFNNAAYGAAGDVNHIAPHSGTLGPHAALGALAMGNGPKAAVSGGIMGMRGPIAKLLLSPEYQAGKGIMGRLSGGAKRDYTPAFDLSPAAKQAMARVAAIMATQKKDKN